MHDKYTLYGRTVAAWLFALLLFFPIFWLSIKQGERPIPMYCVTPKSNSRLFWIMHINWGRIILQQATMRRYVRLMAYFSY